LCYHRSMKTIKKILFILILPLTLLTCNTPPREPRPVVIPFMVDLTDPNFSAGEIETQVRRMFPASGLEKKRVEVIYYPFDDAVCLKFRPNVYEYHQFWSRNGRTAFINALEYYNVDYSNANLDARNRRSGNIYGSDEGYLYWQMYTITRRVSANVKLDIGYTFSDANPYFTVTQNSTSYEDKVSPDNSLDSQLITMYFTRAQARELAQLFDQEYLRGLVPPELSGRRIADTTAEVDDDYNSTNTSAEAEPFEIDETDDVDVEIDEY